MTLRKIIVILGALNALILVSHATFSYVEAPAAHYTDRDRWALAFHDRVGARIASVIAPVAVFGEIGKKNEGERVKELTANLSGGGWMADPRHFVILYATPLVLSTIVTLVLLATLARRPDAVDTNTAASMLRWSYWYALVMAFATPTLAEDFWLSVGWGRMLSMGYNPYYHIFTPALVNLPLESPGMHMTYGPLWALVASAVEWVTRGSTIWSAVLFKALLLIAWISTLHLLSRLVRERSASDQCIAIAMVGWLPIGVVQTMGDGHNDVFMVVLVMLWLWLLEERRSVLGSVALALSVTIKYASAPLFLLDLLHLEDPDSPPSAIQRLRNYLPRGLAAAAVTAIVFGSVFRGAGFFSSTTDVNKFKFFLPSDAVRAVAALTNLPLWRFANWVELIFPVVMLVTIWKYVRTPSRDAFRIAVAGVMLAVLFQAANHVWPWYVIWLLVVAATVPRSLVARWAMGVALTAPFPLIVWIAFPKSDGLTKFLLPALFAYGGALLWTMWLWRYFVPSNAVAKQGMPSRGRVSSPEATV